MHTHYYELGPNRYQERFGLGCDQLEPGMRFVHRPGVTLTQQDNLEEALDSVNAAMIHYDEAYASQTTWKRPLMVSTITLQRLVGLASKTFGLHRKRIACIHEITLKKPMFGGDSLYAESEVLSVERLDDSSGRVQLRTRGINQRGDVVAVLEYTFDMWRSGCLPVQAADMHRPAMQARFASHVQRDDGAWVEQTGLFFEELHVDDVFVHFPRRSILSHESVAHALRSLEISPQYHDLQYALDAGLGPTSVPQTWVLTLCAALSTRTFGRVSANLSWKDVRFERDAAPGSTIEATSTVLDTRLSESRPAEGIVRIRTQAHDESGCRVLSYERTLLVYRRTAGSPYAAAGY